MERKDEMSNKNRIWAVIILLFIPAIGFSETGDRIYDFYSPTYLSSGATVLGGESPHGEIFNPAASASVQRTTIDISYLGIIGAEGYKGHAFNLGNTIPTRAGVFSWSGHFITSPLQDFLLVSQGGVRASFSKDLYPNFYLGAGAGLTLSSGWALTGSLGMLHMPGDLGFFKDFKWGAALQEFGYSSITGDDTDGIVYPSLYTLSLGAGFTFFKNDLFTMKASSDLSFPSFQNLRFRIGGEILLKDFLSLTFATRIDIKELISYSAYGLIPSFGLSYTYKMNLKEDIEFLGITERGWNRSEIKTQVSAAPIRQGVWAYGLGFNIPLGVLDKNPPRISAEYPEEIYISPNHDGIMDELILPITITDERYIQGYRFVITDGTGSEIREIRNKEYRPENEAEKTFFDRIVAVKEGISVPQSLRWEGNDNEGSMVPDGTYSFFIEAWDDNGNIGKYGPKTIHVDNTPPLINIAEKEDQDLIFSPNDDGNKDTLVIEQTGSKEDLWTAVITDAAGTVYREIKWEDSEPKDFEWDGTNSMGILLPDGVYTYTITSKDRAGNTVKATVDNIVMNTMVTPITITIDRSFFSPNNDGEKDTVLLIPNVPVQTGIDTWEMAIVNSAGTTVRAYSGKGQIPKEFVFDGMDNQNRRLPEGSYYGRLTVKYFNGNNPTSVTPQFVLDVTSPRAVIRSDLSIFSPNADGNKDEIIIFQETSSEDIWTGEIHDPEGRVIRKYSWVEKADPKLIWDGRNDNGLLSQDGTYTYRVWAVDRAGNRGVSNIIAFELNTEETPVFLTLEYDAFSPNGSGVKDTIRIIPQLKVAEGIDSYRLSILNEKKEVVRVFTGRGGVNPVRWDGLMDNGRKAPDGNYTAEISILYLNGNNPIAPSRQFLLDTIYPEVTIKTEYTLFSPNGDNNKDTVLITQESSEENLWEGKIKNANGTVLRTAFWKGKTTDYIWDGKDEAGNIVPDGVYAYEIISTDSAGNTTKAEIKGITVDNRQTSVFVTASAKGFSPNGDGVMDEISFNTIVNLREGIESWKLSIDRIGAGSEMVFEGTDRLPSRIIWDGKNRDGRIIEGEYAAQFTVAYHKGDIPRSTTAPFILDVTGPDVAINLSPVPFSPDNDGVEDELIISIGVMDRSAIASWRMIIRDSQGNFFHEFGGEGAPTDKIIWDGKNAKGELVFSAEDYPYTLDITDIYGNRTRRTGIVPVDVLVFRDGDNLKIQIASITFAPNSNAFSTSDQSVIQKNEYVLKRIAQILNRYRGYSIVIEGHANPTRWQNPADAAKEEREELQPLSEKRAQSVKDALVNLGVDSSRINVIGMGGTKTLVHPSERDNIWKNRRVEFILIKRN